MVDWPVEWDYPRVLFIALAAVTLVALVAVASTSSAAFGTYNPAWDGASELRELARDTGADVTIARNLDPYGEAAPSETVAVVLSPTEPYSGAEATRLRRFLERGGTLVVADDFGPHGNGLLRQLGADSRISGTLLRDDRHFHRSPSLPVATNVSEHRLTAGVAQLTLNHGSAVEPNGATVLVRTSSFGYADTNDNGALDTNESLGQYPVVTAESIGGGTLVVVGDPSLFINVMLERPGNTAFVTNLFGEASFVVLDYSHVGGFPPLSLALLVLRDTAVLQVVVGLLGLGVIGWWSRGGGLGSLAERFRDEPAPSTPGLTEDQLVAYVARQHPDWDEERVRRVVGGILTQRGQAGGDD